MEEVVIVSEKKITKFSSILTKEYLQENYINLDKSATQIAKDVGCSQGEVLKSLKKYGITVSTSSQKRKGRIVPSRRIIGYGEIPGKYWGGIIRKAKIYNREFSISIHYAYEIFINQNRRCALSGVPIGFPREWTNHTVTSQSASLDRIDSSLGYIEGNVQWVHKDINKMKLNKSDYDFIKLCQTVADYSRSKNN